LDLRGLVCVSHQGLRDAHGVGTRRRHCVVVIAIRARTTCRSAMWEWAQNRV